MITANRRGSEGTRINAALEQTMLPGHVARMRIKEKREKCAELCRSAETIRRVVLAPMSALPIR